MALSLNELPTLAKEEMKEISSPRDGSEHVLPHARPGCEHSYAAAGLAWGKHKERAHGHLAPPRARCG